MPQNAADAARTVDDAAADYAAAAAGRITAWLTQRLAVEATPIVTRALAEEDVSAERIVERLSPWLANTEHGYERALLDALIAAQVAGWRAGEREQDAVLPASIRVAPRGTQVPADQIAAALAGWTVIGHTREAIARHHAATWRYQAASVTGTAAATGDADEIIPGLTDVAQRTRTRDATVLGDAFMIGAAAARYAVGRVLANAASR